jgi:hypothetical protein
LPFCSQACGQLEPFAIGCILGVSPTLSGLPVNIVCRLASGIVVLVGFGWVGCWSCKSVCFRCSLLVCFAVALCVQPVCRSLCWQVVKDMKAAKNMYTQFLDQDEFFGECGTLSERADKVRLKVRITELEGWTCRIALGAAKCRAKNPPKAMQGKHKACINQGDDYVPCDLLHPAVWKVCDELLPSLAAPEGAA